MRLSNLQKMMLNDLFKSTEGLYIYTLYSRYNSSPKELYLAIEDLVNKTFIKSEDERLTITTAGIEFAVKTNELIKSKSNKLNNIQENFTGPKIEINQFYIPKITN